jgi:hypothetical protein
MSTQTIETGASYYTTHYGFRQLKMPERDGPHATKAAMHSLRAYNTAVDASNAAHEARQKIDASDRWTDAAKAEERRKLADDAAPALAQAAAEHRRAADAQDTAPLRAFDVPTDPATVAMDAEMRAFLRQHTDRAAFVAAAARERTPDNDAVLRAILTAHPALSNISSTDHAQLNDRAVRDLFPDKLEAREQDARHVAAAERAVSNGIGIAAKAAGVSPHDLERTVAALARDL